MLELGIHTCEGKGEEARLGRETELRHRSNKTSAQPSKEVCNDLPIGVCPEVARSHPASLSPKVGNPGKVWPRHVSPSAEADAKGVEIEDCCSRPFQQSNKNFLEGESGWPIWSTTASFVLFKSSSPCKFKEQLLQFPVDSSSKGREISETNYSPCCYICLQGCN